MPVDSVWVSSALVSNKRSIGNRLYDFWALLAEIDDGIRQIAWKSASLIRANWGLVVSSVVISLLVNGFWETSHSEFCSFSFFLFQQFAFFVLNLNRILTILFVMLRGLWYPRLFDYLKKLLFWESFFFMSTSVYIWRTHLFLFHHPYPNTKISNCKLTFRVLYRKFSISMFRLVWDE